jgi:organic radical activating enzyme
MPALSNWIREQFTRVKPLPAENLHYQAPPGDELPYRLHLRLQGDGSALLILNAATVLHLNPTAAEYAYHMVKGSKEEVVARDIHRRYRVGTQVALRDFNEFRQRIETLVHTPDLDPVSYLDFERLSPHSAQLTAPLRLDCALTYRLPEDTRGEYAPVKRVDRELTTSEWCSILDTAWKAGIPQVTFTGGEPTLRDDLPDLVAHAEKNGQVCGLLTDGLKMAEKGYLDKLLQTGLDHLLFILQPDEKRSWQALEAILAADLFVTVHFTLTPGNTQKAEDVLERLSKAGVRNISLTTSDPSLKERLAALHEQLIPLDLMLRWDLPVPYGEDNPIASEVIDDAIPEGAGKVWLYVEPDGDVLPAQGEADKVLGNMLRDPWESIYKV